MENIKICRNGHVADELLAFNVDVKGKFPNSYPKVQHVCVSCYARMFVNGYLGKYDEYMTNRKKK